MIEDLDGELREQAERIRALANGERDLPVDGIAPELANALVEILRERMHQIQRWGDGDLPDGTGVEYRPLRDAVQARCDEADKAGTTTWALALLEEVLEVLSETDPARMMEELRQVGALSAAWMENLQRRGQGENST